MMRINPFLLFGSIYSRDAQIVSHVWPEDEIEDARMIVQDPCLTLPDIHQCAR